MKALFGSLLCLVFTISETYALKGGPPYPGGGTNIIGRYAGVLRPPFCPLADPAQCPFGLNSLGLFTLSLPENGLGAGTAFIFSSGRTFTGTITASGDPNTGAISGVLDTSYEATCASTLARQTFATAGGKIDGKVSNRRAGANSTTSILLKGTAVVSVRCLLQSGFFSCANTSCSEGSSSYQLDGFKQSNSL
jgi:hypothetical protein